MRLILAAAVVLSAHALSPTRRWKPRRVLLLEGGERHAPEWDTIRFALSTYHGIYGNLCIETSFKVPQSDPWPASLHGSQIGKTVYQLQFWKEFLAAYPSRRRELGELGFIWGRLQPEYNLILEALWTFREQHDHLNIPQSFVVPCEDPWPRSTWKLRLGMRVAHMRSRGHHVNTERWFQLDAMGFEWTAFQDNWERTRSALELFKAIHGHLKVPRHFVIPESDDWPSRLAGFKLGYTVNNLRNRRVLLTEHPDRMRLLEALGFIFDPEAHAFSELFDALVCYRQLYGHVQVPQKFVVPEEVPWPEDVRGMRLGTKVSTVRTKGALVRKVPERIELLNKLGFVWKPPRGRLRKAKRGAAPQAKRPSSERPEAPLHEAAG